MGLFTLKEAFVGKTHELLLAEQYIAQLREKYMVKNILILQKKLS